MFSRFRRTEPEPDVSGSAPVFQPDVVINGSVKGSVEGDCNVLVDARGHCVGSLKVKDLVIHGTVIGDVYANELVIYPTGQLYYRNVFAQNTIVHEGGVYTGHRDDVGTEPQKAEVEISVTLHQEPKTESSSRIPSPDNKEDKPKKRPTFISTY